MVEIPQVKAHGIGNSVQSCRHTRAGMEEKVGLMTTTNGGFFLSHFQILVQVTNNVISDYPIQFPARRIPDFVRTAIDLDPYGSCIRLLDWTPFHHTSIISGLDGMPIIGYTNIPNPQTFAVYEIGS